MSFIEMIEINLLPEELKLKTRKAISDIKLRRILYLLPLFFGILIMIHIYLAGALIIKNIQLNSLNNKWQMLKPQRKLVEDFNKECEGLSQDAKIIQQLISQRINWSEKLNKLSLNLPSGIWFNEISLSRKDFVLKASVVSLQKEEISQIYKLTDNLKNDRDFFKDFNDLELSSVKRKVVGGYDVVDFILTGKLK